MTRILSFALLAMASLSAMAHEGASNPIEQIDVRGLGRLEYQHLFTETSAEGETLDAFVLRISPRLRAFSDATGFEACGVLAKSGDRHGVVIGTNRSHMACGNFPDFVPEGMEPTKLTIHSHGRNNSNKPNKNDRVLAGNQLDSYGLGLNTRRPIQILGGQDIDEFSDRDFQGGAGYLAIPGGALFQDGTKKQRRVE